MARFWLFGLFFFLSACSTEYYIVDEEVAVNNEESVVVNDADMYSVEGETDEFALGSDEGRLISADDVFVVGEGSDFVTYQYKNVRVDEISPLASMYCADVAYGGSPYLREVSLYHNGFMRATFDCVSLAI